MKAKPNSSAAPDRPAASQSVAPLTPEQERLQCLLIGAADHAILSRSIESFRRLFAGDRPADAAAEFTAIQWLLMQKLPEHVAYEEEQAFPALLASHPSPSITGQIAGLRREHVALQAAMRRLNKLLVRRTPATCTGELWTALLDFFEVLEQHTRHEDSLIAHLNKPEGPAPA